MRVVRVNGDPICVVAMSPTGRQNLTIVGVGYKRGKKLFFSDSSEDHLVL